LDTLIQKFQFSCFERPVFNHWPCGVGTPFGVYRYEKSDKALDYQNTLRGLTDEKAQRPYKEKNFCWVTPAGRFSYAADDKILSYSCLMCMDLDYLCHPSEIDEENGDPVTELREKLLKDPFLDTILLFRSVRGCGLKWWVVIDLEKYDYATYFTGIRHYLMSEYHLTDKQCDKQVANLSRGCFLGHDAHCYLKPELIKF